MRHPRQWETLRYINNKTTYISNQRHEKCFVCKNNLVSDDTSQPAGSHLRSYYSYTILRVFYTTNNTTCNKQIAHENCLLSTASFETPIRHAPHVPNSLIDRPVHLFLPRANTKTITAPGKNIPAELIVFLQTSASHRHIHKSSIQRQNIK